MYVETCTAKILADDNIALAHNASTAFFAPTVTYGFDSVELANLGSTRVIPQSGRTQAYSFEAPEMARRLLKHLGIRRNQKFFVTKVSNSAVRVSLHWRNFSFIDLFAGIGGMRLGFEPLAGRCIFTSEWDTSAQVTYEANFGDCPAGDITKIDPSTIPDHDILLAGFPCQPFSIIGNRAGFADTRGTLFFNIEQILKAKQPEAILLENVKQFRTHDDGRTYSTVIDSLERLGYSTHTSILNALDYGVPQKRERTFIVGFRDNICFNFPRPFPHRAELGDFLQHDSEIDPSLMGTEYIRAKRLARAKAQNATIFEPSIWHENKGGHLGIHPFSCALRHNASHNYLMVNGQRRLSGRECLRLQGFPDTFKIVVPYRSIRAQAGNAVAVPVIRSIATCMLHALRRNRAATPQADAFLPFAT